MDNEKVSVELDTKNDFGIVLKKNETGYELLCFTHNFSKEEYEKMLCVFGEVLKRKHTSSYVLIMMQTMLNQAISCRLMDNLEFRENKEKK